MNLSNEDKKELEKIRWEGQKQIRKVLNKVKKLQFSNRKHRQHRLLMKINLKIGL